MKNAKVTETKLKDYVRARDGKCADCGITDERHIIEFGQNLHVHRLDAGKAYNSERCICLCYLCHRRRHDILINGKACVALRVEDETREALRLESVLAGKSAGEIVDELIAKHLAETIVKVRARRAMIAEYSGAKD